MKPFEFMHCGSIIRKSNKHFTLLRTKLSEFNEWQTMDVVGLRDADDNIVFLMYSDNNKNFKQYNNKTLIASYKAIVDDLDNVDKMHEFMQEVETQIAGKLCQKKDLTFRDTTVSFIKDGKTVKNYVTFNVVQKVSNK